MIAPWSRQAAPATSAVASSSSCRSTSARTARPSVLGGRDQRRGRGRAVLGLAEQVRGDELGVGGLVGDDRDLRRARRAGRCRRARRAGAWPRPRRRCPRRRSCRRARCPPSPNAIAASACTPPRAKIAVGAAQRGAVDERRVDAVPPRCGGAHATTVSTPATFGTSTVMNGGGEQRDAAGGQVGADALHRHEPVAGDDAAARPRPPGRSSVARWARAKASMRSRERCRCARRSSSTCCSARVDLRAGELERVGVPAVEVARVAAQRVLAAALDVEQDLAHPLRDRRVVPCADLDLRALEEQQVLVVEQALGDHGWMVCRTVPFGTILLATALSTG